MNLSLLLNVNNPQEAKGAYAALLPAATTLSVQLRAHMRQST